jgi:hypothetical protein
MKAPWPVGFVITYCCRRLSGRCLTHSELLDLRRDVGGGRIKKTSAAEEHDPTSAIKLVSSNPGTGDHRRIAGRKVLLQLDCMQLLWRGGHSTKSNAALTQAALSCP